MKWRHTREVILRVLMKSEGSTTGPGEELNCNIIEDVILR
jgi:hypothetical protein